MTLAELEKLARPRGILTSEEHANGKTRTRFVCIFRTILEQVCEVSEPTAVEVEHVRGMAACIWRFGREVDDAEVYQELNKRQTYMTRRHELFRHGLERNNLRKLHLYEAADIHRSLEAFRSGDWEVELTVVQGGKR